MSDDPNATAAAGGDTTAAPAIEKPAADTGDGGESLASMVDGAAAAAAGPATWPDDWRERLTNGDEAGMALLKRYPSVDDLYKRVLSQEQIIRRGQHKAAPTLPENPTEEQVAEYRKAIGVPETPEGYGLKFAEDLKPTEADTELLTGFLADMHRQHMPPVAAKAAFDWYQGQVARMREEQTATMQRQRHANEVTFRKEFGADYMRNLGIADEFLDGYPGLKKLISPYSDTEVLRDIFKLAHDSADEDALYGGDVGGGGKSLDDRIAELRRKSALGTLTTAEDAQYNELLDKRMQRDNRRNRAA